jgi:3-hydroxybutyryl-CoA dehydrogenase
MSRDVIGVIGAGTMGRGIAQVFAEAGHRVIFHDQSPEQLTGAVGFIHQMIDRAVEKGRKEAAEGEAAKARLEPAAGLDAFAPCDIVVEAIVEAVEPKQELFAALAEICGPQTVLCTNTSSLSVTAIAAGVPHPERVAGLHFFNPVPLMKLAEVIPGARTMDGLCDRLTALVEGIGHRPVRAADSPGFLVNHAGRGLYTEGLRIVQEGVATTHQVDAVMREAAGFRMGPFELLDLTGLDVSYPVMRLIYEQFWQEPRFRPSPLPPIRVAAGLLGRKTGEGFYAYDGQKIQRPPEPPVPELAALPPVQVAGEGGSALAEALDVEWISPRTTPRRDALLLVAPMGEDATTTALRHGLDATRTVAVDMLFGIAGRRTAMTTPVTDPAMRDAAHAFLARDANPVTMIHDSPGFIAQRVVATIVNIACEIAQQRIATPEDIDLAVTLGLGYPSGPLALGDRLGPGRLQAILEGIQAATGDPRYRPSLWLSRRARLGVSLLTPEG